MCGEVESFVPSLAFLLSFCRGLIETTNMLTGLGGHIWLRASQPSPLSWVLGMINQDRLEELYKKNYLKHTHTHKRNFEGLLT